MEGEYGGPDFSYAYGGAASWNPALRPNHEVKDAVASKQDVPAAALVDNEAMDALVAADPSDNTSQEEGQPAVNGHPPIAPETRSGDDFFDRYDDSLQPQNAEDIIESQDSETAPEANYEHQSESTFLEDAIQESSSAPIIPFLDDNVISASEPTNGLPESAKEESFDWGASDDTFDLGFGDTVIKQAQPEVATSVHPEPRVPHANEDIDWGTSDNHSFDLGGAVQQPGQISDELHGKNETQDLDAIWKAALDDEDFLTEDAPADTGAFFVDDGEGFLDETADETTAESLPANTNRYAPQASLPQSPATNNSFGQRGLQDATTFPQSSIKQEQPANTLGAYGQPIASTKPQVVDQANASQSFADKAKGGYASPFDLPDDLAKPRRRPAGQYTTQNVASPTFPPNRTSSMYSNASSAALPPPPSSHTSPPSSGHSIKAPPNFAAAASSQSQPTSSPASSEFFAELPVLPKPRPHAATARSASQPSTILSQPPPPKSRDVWPPPGQEQQANPLLVSGLQQPARLPPFPDLADAPPQLAQPPPPTTRYSPAPSQMPSSTMQAPPPVASRYSPAPPPGSSGGQSGSPSSRYSPAPTASGPPSNKPTYPASQASSLPHSKYAADLGGPPRPPFQQFAPRTSSPLAHNTSIRENAHHNQGGYVVPDDHVAATLHSGLSSESFSHPPRKSSLEGVREVEESEPSLNTNDGSLPSFPAQPLKPATPPPPRGGPPSATDSPRRRAAASYVPQAASSYPAPEAGFTPPRRSQSQSPGTSLKTPKHLLATAIERPASVHDATGFAGQQSIQIIPHRRGFSRDLDFIVPTDQRASDPLERWKGYPVFSWGLGGNIVTSFPKYMPLYGAGQVKPMMRSCPGEIRLLSLKDTYPLPDSLSKFPGPLKGKSKKKDLLVWLKGHVEAVELDGRSNGFADAESAKRHDEKLLLLKVLHLLVEHDGRLEGSVPVEQAVHAVLSDGLSRGPQTSGSVRSDAAESTAIAEIETLLSNGEREKAAWFAADHRLWGHALLLSSTLNRDIWKRVVQEFVQKEVKIAAGNTRALATLYEVFAGNLAESIDELVPASARAGFQMINTAGRSTTNALEGIEQWRNTLLLILSNRTEGDVQALVSLGRLLAEYHRIEAAHICLLFARSIAYLGGADDLQSDIVLLGANHKVDPHHLAQDLESIILTEVLEYALSLASSSAAAIPHLQPYKLAHAYVLAEHGLRNDALQYCDAIAASMKATTRGSPYYHSNFTLQLDDLSKRLSQSPKDPSSSWISKPSMEKVSGSLLAKFNSFVAGDDTDAASNHSGSGGDIGPFAKIAGNTPRNLSPSQSNLDMYGAYKTNGSINPPAAPATTAAPPVNSRYAPTSAYAPRAASMDSSSRSRYEPGTTYQPGKTSLESPESPFAVGRDLDASNHGMSQSYSQSPSNPPPMSQSYSPSQPQSNYTPSQPQSSYAPSQSQPSYTPYAGDMSNSQGTDMSSSYQPLDTADTSEHPSQSQEAYGYEPPSMGYEPPSYQPYEPEPEPEDRSGESAKEVRKKSFMDDDDENDDLANKAADLKKQQRAQADKEAEENFRRAAEADAAKAKQAAGDKKGWFGGWFGGKKDPNTPVVYKAKLGEESSFVYDPELKRWVNKKAGADNLTPAASGTPPPPKDGPSSRSASVGNLAPPPTSAPPQAFSAPPTRPPTSNPMRSTSMPIPPRTDSPGSGAEGTPPTLAPPGGALSKPPSRPGTAMSNASSIDDLLGAPQARKGGAKKAKRGGRYVDVMGQK